MTENEKDVSSLVQGLHKVAAKAKQGNEGGAVTGAIVMLDYDNGTGTTHMIGNMAEVNIYGRCIALCLDLHHRTRQIEAMEAVKAQVAMSEKTSRGVDEH